MAQSYDDVKNLETVDALLERSQAEIASGHLLEAGQLINTARQQLKAVALRIHERAEIEEEP